MSKKKDEAVEQTYDKVPAGFATEWDKARLKLLNSGKRRKNESKICKKK